MTHSQGRSPIIIPSLITRVSCSIINLNGESQDPLEPPERKSQEETNYINSAIDFLSGIEIGLPELNRGKTPSLSPLKSPREPSGKSYKESLETLFTYSMNIDLSEYPSKIGPSPLKSDLNSEFRNKYRQLNKKLTLSKIVNLREKLFFKVLKDVDIEACTVAMA